MARSVRRSSGPASPPLLDFVIDSTVVGIAKPDPRVFALGLQAAGVEAREAVYIGDSYFVDVVGARGAGLGAVLFDPGGVWGARDCPSVAGLREAADRATAPSPS
jgi:putative hydrolase of the HAD superfamily